MKASASDEQHSSKSVGSTGNGTPLPADEPVPSWQEWEDTSDDDVRRDTYGPARMRELERQLR